ncbi:MAG: zinc ribbon domain-containing protein [Phycisphaerae bacterium]|nr:zinc ribbon domain-containing protein [Phycisphaerae bacterium]
MPTYDYKCNACGHAFEEFQSMTAPHLKKCPKCGKNKLERLIGTGAALMFKGSGFYITDYRSDSYKKAAEAEKGGGKSDGAKDGGTKSDGAKAEPVKTEPAAKSKPDAPAKSESKSESKSQSTSRSRKSKDA